MHLGKTSKKREISCPELIVHQGSSYGSHGSSEIPAAEKCISETKQNVTKMLETKNCSELGSFIHVITK